MRLLTFVFLSFGYDETAHQAAKDARTKWDPKVVEILLKLFFGHLSLGFLLLPLSLLVPEFLSVVHVELASEDLVVVGVHDTHVYAVFPNLFFLARLNTILHQAHQKKAGQLKFQNHFNKSIINF